MRHKWSDREIAWIRREYTKRPLPDLLDAFNWEFGLDLSLNQLRAAIKNRKIKSGRDGRFSKGHESWNKGMKGLEIGGLETRFKKGNLSGNARKRIKPLGYERINADGYRDRKIRMDGPLHKRWKAVHRILWEEHHGPIPEGHVVVFINGDKADIRIDNLALLPRRSLGAFNSRGWSYLPADIRESAIHTVRLEAAAREAESRT